MTIIIFLNTGIEKSIKNRDNVNTRSDHLRERSLIKIHKKLKQTRKKCSYIDLTK